MKHCLQKKGFTLIELLVATAMVVTIVSMVYGSYFATSQSVRLCRTRIANFHQGQEVLRQITRQIRGAYAPAGSDVKKSLSEPGKAGSLTNAGTVMSKQTTFETDKSINYFAGGCQNPDGQVFLHLVTANPVSLEQKRAYGLFEVRYKFDKRQGQLFLNQGKFVGSVNKARQKRDYQLIAEDIQELELAFFDGQKWQKSWSFNDEKKLPTAVKIEITTEDQNHHKYHYGIITHVYCVKNQDKEIQSDKILSLQDR